nr:kinesin-like protein KIF18B [Rhipicephalus microplus]
MAPSQNSKRRSCDTAKAAPKCRRPGNNTPSPMARVNVAVRVRPLNERESETSSIIYVGDDRDATRTGKTFTMLGSEDCHGVVSLTASELYRRVDKLRTEGLSCDVAVAYMKVYKEVVRDLLCPKGRWLVVRDDSAKGIAISNHSIHKVKEYGALFEFLLKGNRNWTQHTAQANSESSWSHALFHVYVTQGDSVTSTSKGIRFFKIREGTKIHLSLLALGNCIDAISKAGALWVPHRDSKLTQILKDSLSGTCHTLLIAAVSPSKLSYTDTHNTLKCGKRAINIELQTKKKVLNVNAHTPLVEANEPSDVSNTAYCLDAARKIYAGQAKIIRQIWENENIIRASAAKDNWKQEMAKTVKLLQGSSEDNLYESEHLHHFLQSQAAKHQTAKVKLEALDNKRRRNFECSKDLLNEESAAGCLQAVVAEIVKLELVVERTEMQGQRQMFA